MSVTVKIKAQARVVRRTTSVCPVCLERVAAVVVRRRDGHFMEKTCAEHGFFSTVVWRGVDLSYEGWAAGYSPPADGERNIPDCPNACGLCAGHLQKTCCVLVEITSRCDLSCPVCFAQSGGNATEPSVSALFSQFRQLVEDGNTFVQLSGGEPTMREDLVDIVSAAKKARCENIQLNTNGIRLGMDKTYAKTLREAGLSFVFMQFDGTEDEIFTTLRGRPMLNEKKAAIANCAEASLGVTLVPTLVPGVNEHNIGYIVYFGFSNSPVVRGVHFQPISYIGRYPHPPANEDRITLPEVLIEIEKQTGGKVGISDFAPSRCDHPYCGFHGDFVVLPKKAIMKLTQKTTATCCSDDEHLKNRSFVARRWNRSEQSEADSNDNDDFNELNAFAKRLKSHGFTITAMAFQDAYNLDIERLRRCSLHVSSGGRMTPFCAKYLTRASRQEERREL